MENIKKNSLKSRKRIEELFNRSQTITQDFITIYWAYIKNNDTDNSVLFSVPKKNVPLSTKRNRIKRLLRESYWRNQHIINNKTGNLMIAFIYQDSELLDFKLVEIKIKLILQRLNEIL